MVKTLTPEETKKRDLLASLFPDHGPNSGWTEEVELISLPDDEELGGPAPDRALIESIKKIGVLQNVVLQERYHGGAVDVIAGRRRIKAARAAGLVSIPALIFAPQHVTLEVIALMENALRSANKPVERDYLETLKRKGLTDSEIAQVTGMDTATVKKRLRLSGLTHVLMARWEKGEIADGVAEQAAALTYEQQLGLEAEEKITAAEVKKAREAEVESSLSGIDLPVLDPEATLPLVTGRRYRIGLLIRQALALLTEADDPQIKAHLDAAMEWVGQIQEEKE